MLQRKEIAAVLIKVAWLAIKTQINMDNFNRDLLVLFKESNQKSIEREVELLHELLFYVEKIENVITAFEVINVNKYKIFSDKKILRDTINQRELKPFVFLFNMN
jgi:hypothetical protein